MLKMQCEKGGLSVPHRRSCDRAAPAPVNALAPASACLRWWVYQQERFPVLAHGLLIAAFSASAVSFSCLLHGGHQPPQAASYLVAFVSSFLLFLQLRIADEFKDFEEDSRYRPYRPVPRGLVTLRELAVIGLVAAVVQMGLALWLAPGLALLLALTWFYLALMTREFFVREWICARPITYLWTHMLILPLADFYATACDWFPAAAGPPAGLSWFIALSFFNGVALELGRKIRAPGDEEEGVRTYSYLWGRKTAALAWLATLAVTAACAILASAKISFIAPVATLLIVLLVGAAALVYRYLSEPVTRRAKMIEHFSGGWTLVLYLMLGVIPLLCKTVSASQ
jgi:4-hydroxybenzoate polyprenyltransferase